MLNLYDLLGVRPDDDADDIKKAFRKAAKASHPDHHGGDPQAAARFRRITKAYEILRDAEQRAAYDRLLAFERRPLGHEPKRSRSGVKRHVVQGLTAGALLVIVLAVGYELYSRVPQTPGDEAAGITVPKSELAAADHAVERIGAAGRDRPERVMPAPAASAANDRDRPEMTDGAPVSNPTGQTTAVASRDSASDVPTGADGPGKTEGELPVQHDVPSLDAPFSPAEERNSVPAAGDRRDGKTPGPAGANTVGMKPPEINMKPPDIKISARAPAAAKRHAPSRRPLEQPAPENRNTPAPDDAPSRVFGVGF
jgi:hypothetical protein